MIRVRFLLFLFSPLIANLICCDFVSAGLPADLDEAIPRLFGA